MRLRCIKLALLLAIVTIQVFNTTSLPLHKRLIKFGIDPLLSHLVGFVSSSPCPSKSPLGCKKASR